MPDLGSHLSRNIVDLSLPVLGELPLLPLPRDHAACNAMMEICSCSTTALLQLGARVPQVQGPGTYECAAIWTELPPSRPVERDTLGLHLRIRNGERSARLVMPTNAAPEALCLGGRRPAELNAPEVWKLLDALYINGLASTRFMVQDFTGYSYETVDAINLSIIEGLRRGRLGGRQDP